MSICKAQQHQWSTGDEPALAGRDDLIRQFPSLISSIQGDPELANRPSALVPNCCVIQCLAQDADFQRFLIWRKSLKIPPKNTRGKQFVQGLCSSGELAQSYRWNPWTPSHNGSHASQDYYYFVPLGSLPRDKSSASFASYRKIGLRIC